jgi:DEAD/DEAH box helicase domain-containing protein
MSFTCFVCRKKPLFVNQFTDKLGFLEFRGINIEYCNQNYIIKKQPWKELADIHDVGFYCSKCNERLETNEEEISDFIQEHSLLDIRKRSVTSGEFDSNKICREIKRNFDSNDYFEHTVEAQQGKTSQIPYGINEGIRQILKNNFGIEKLWEHQAIAIQNILDGKDIVLATSTASGKSMCYNIPMLNLLSTNQTNSRFLYIAPTKALAYDQIKTISKFGVAVTDDDGAIRRFVEDGLIDQVIDGNRITIVKFDSEIAGNNHAKITAMTKGNIFYTTPDKIHSTILQYSSHQYKHNGQKHSWANFFETLRYIIIDEIHTYKGVFGANVAMVMRRLIRMCEMHGNKNIQFISCSATIDNPKELADLITNRNNELINIDTAPKKLKKYLLIRPITDDENDSKSPVSVAADYVTDFLSRDEAIRSLIFGRTMSNVANTQRIIKKRLLEKFQNQDLDQIIKFFQGNLPDKQRQKILNHFNNKEYHAIVSTIALELGVDIDDVHAVIMMGYPGSTSSFYQQAGRAGRKGEGLILTAFFNNPLENYYFNNPDYFFNKPPEKVKIMVNNPKIVEKHLLFSEFERGVTKRDYKYFPKKCVDDFIKNPPTTQNINELYSKSIRTSIGDSIEIFSHEKKVSGSIDYNVAKRDVFVGAIYRTPDCDYLIEEIDWKAKVANARPIRNPDYYTKSNNKKSVTTIQILDSLTYGSFKVNYEEIKFTSTPLNYFKLYYSSRVPEKKDFSNFQPNTEFETNSLRLIIGEHLIKDIMHDIDFEKLIEGAVSIENAMFSMFADLVECDVNDIGSCLTYTKDKEVNIYLFDNFSNGLEITKESYKLFPRFIDLVYNLINNCTCNKDEGCPSCVQRFQPFNPVQTNRKIALEILNKIKTCI